LRQEFEKTLRHRGTAESLDALVDRDVHYCYKPSELRSGIINSAGPPSFKSATPR
jgi:hypothetical protein